MSDWGSSEQPSYGTPPQDAAQPAAAGMAAGWYPDPSGRSRWWDGAQWGPYAEGQAAGYGAQPQAQQPMPGYGYPQVAAVPNPRNQAALAHWLGLVVIPAPGLSWIGPLIIYSSAGSQDPFVKHHAAESLNFQITMTIGFIVSFILMFFCIGFLTGAVLWVMAVIFSIMGAQAATRGEWYRYPMNIRMVGGAAV